MSTTPRKASSLGIYHVIYRGVDKQRIFEDEQDCNKFLDLLRKYQFECDYKVLAYCLMSNHIHLLVGTGGMPLGQIFQHIATSFAIWYNIKYQRVGHLFQARFLSEPVHDASQLLIVIRYIHRNPVKALICQDPAQYGYSSFKDYFDNDLIDAKIVLELVSKEYFWSYNRTENDDRCIDIEEEAPRVLTDDRAVKIMKDISGCNCASEFKKLAPESRNKALRAMRRAGISAKQANRITGVPYKLIRRVIYKPSDPAK